MKSEKIYEVSFKEMALRGSRILAQQSEISLEKALKQVQLLKETSKVKDSSKKGRSNS